MWVIYERPKDHPDSFVVRRAEVYAGSKRFDEQCTLASSLEDARHALPRGLTRLGRHPADEPSIVEVWV